MQTNAQRLPVLASYGLGKVFVNHERAVKIVAAEGAEVKVYPGQLTALLGPSGAGKSSVLKCIYRSYLPSSGVIWYQAADGTMVDLVTASEELILRLRRDEIGFVTQFLHCLPRQSTLDVVAGPLYALGTARAEGQRAARALLAAIGLPERLWTLPPASFSGGEKQRVNLARGLIRRPQLLLLDEPTASLDPLAVSRVVELLQHLKAEGVAMLAIFHDPALVEKLADHVVRLAATSLTEDCDANPDL